MTTRPHPDDLPPALRRVLSVACGGDWRRVTVDESGVFTVHNQPQWHRTTLPDVRPRPRRLQTQRASQRPSWRTVLGAADGPGPPVVEVSDLGSEGLRPLGVDRPPRLPDPRDDRSHLRRLGLEVAP